MEQMWEPFVHGILLAFGLILPLGVQNVFIFTQGALHSRLWKAAPAVITASLCDTLLIVLAVQGVSLLLLQWIWLKNVLFAAGFLFLLYIGYSLWRSAGDGVQQHHRADTIKRQMIFTASVSLLNPHAIMDTIGVIGTSSLQYAGTDRVIFAAAAVLVSWLWFISLAIAGRVLRKLDTTGQRLAWLNKGSAVLIWGMAGYMLLTMLKG